MFSACFWLSTQSEYSKDKLSYFMLWKCFSNIYIFMVSFLHTIYMQNKYDLFITVLFFFFFYYFYRWVLCLPIFLWVWRKMSFIMNHLIMDAWNITKKNEKNKLKRNSKKRFNLLINCIHGALCIKVDHL